MIKVSVVVPCYKVEKYIAKCIESIQNQDFKDLEIILVDDGSPDNTGKICDDYSKNDDRIIVIHKVNGGVSSARNDGLKIAKGDYVIFADSDDYFPNGSISHLYYEAIKRDADIVIGDVIKVYSDGREEYCSFYKNGFFVTFFIAIFLI